MKCKQLMAIGPLAGLATIAAAQVRTQAPMLAAQITNIEKTGINAATNEKEANTEALITISVPVGARQTFAGLGASTGNWGSEYQSLTGVQRAQLSRMLWRDLNFKIFRLWFNVDNYSPARGVQDMTLFRNQYVKSGQIADAQANGVTTLVLAPDHIPPYMRSGDQVDGPINDAE